MKRLLASNPFCGSWITWGEIHTIVMRQKSVLLGSPSSIAASLHRIADGVAPVVQWCSGPYPTLSSLLNSLSADRGPKSGKSVLPESVTSFPNAYSGRYVRLSV